MIPAASSSAARTRVVAYTRAVIIAVSTFVFLSVIPFLPGYPVLQILLAAGLCITSFKRPVWTAGVLALLALLTVMWQLIGFGLISLIATPVGLLTAFLLLLFIVFDMVSARLQPTAMALALLAVALMLTPYYYLSIGAIVVAAALGGLASIGPVSTTFLSTLTPLLLIDNSIYYSGAGTGPQTPPIIFSQLSYLSSNLVPPLGSLNVFLSGIGPGVASPYAQTFVTFVSGERTAVLLIPIVLLAVVFSASASIAGIINSLISRLNIFGRFNHLVKLFSPLIAAVATPTAFTYLMIALSPPDLGGYQTALSQHPSDILLLLVTSAMLGVLATGREFFIQRLERVEFARNELSVLLERAKGIVAGTRETLAKIVSEASTVDVTSESKQLDETESYTSDMTKGMDTASYSSLEGWLSDMKTRLLPMVENMPEALRIAVIDELNKLKAFASTHNSQLEAAGSGGRFPDPPDVKGDMSTEEALAKYSDVTEKIATSSREIFQEYKSAAGAFNVLMGSELIAPPVDPESLVQSHDYITVMKLLADEYWTNFHLAHTEDLESRFKGLQEKLVEVTELLDPEARGRIESLSAGSEVIVPARSQALLAKVVDVRDTIKDSLARAMEESRELERLVRTFKAGALNVVRFEALEQSNTIGQLQAQLDRLDPSLGDITSFLEDSIPVFTKLKEGRIADEHSLVLLSQYHIAEKYIESVIKDRKAVPLTELPFQREAALMYVKLYSLTSRVVKYDDYDEAIVTSHA
ncbi:MAG TPA: hypothetical protein VEJ36_08370 [Nitrososphaerales archaeon]|nr:hypothetical protein [Nitrososphaerales archaeon]